MASCGSDLSDDPITLASFPDIILDLNFPENAVLRNSGGSRIINGGVRGIIVYRENASTFHAFERNCSFQPGDACATVDVHSSGLFMTDACCNSSFSFPNGNPSGGPAWRPLRRYQAQLTGNSVIISDNSIE
jgi:nitrite reductase/ring-hydroxylating ferredoxin subunit